MKELLQDIRESLKGRVILDRQDKRELVNTIANKVIVNSLDIDSAIRDSL